MKHLSSYIFAAGLVGLSSGVAGLAWAAGESDGPRPTDPRILELQHALEHNDGSLCALDPSTLEHESHDSHGEGESHGPSLVDYYDWGFEGPLGQFDTAQLQRGFAVFAQVCSACHGMEFVGYRHLQEIGVPAAVLAPYMQGHYPDGVLDENFVRTVGLQDNWPAVTNAVNGAVPPDLSTIAAVRYKYLGAGTDYLFNLLLGYPTERQGENANGGVNCFFKGEIIAMEAPMTLDTTGIYENAMAEGLLTEDEMAAETLVQYVADVSAFMAWTADPNRNTMNRNGLFWVLFFALLSLVTYLTFRAVAQKVHADQKRDGGPWTQL